MKKKKDSTYSSRDSLLVIHATTSPPITFLNRDERTGILYLTHLWPYVIEKYSLDVYILKYSVVVDQTGVVGTPA